MTRSLHIVITVNAAWNVLNFRKPLVAALLAQGHRITVLAPADAAAAGLAALGCRFVPLEMDRKGLDPLRDAALAWRMRRHFAELAPDVILGFTIKNNLYGAIAARSLAIPFIPNVTGLGTAFLGGRLLGTLARTLYRLAFRGLPVVFFQNADDRDLFVAQGLVSRSQATLVPGSGIDLAAFPATPRPRPREGAPVRFLLIARLLRDKGVYEYVEAARTLRRQGIPAEFAMLGAVGADNRTAVGQAELDDWLAEGAVTYLGTLDDVRPAIADADCIVLPSYREGAPRTLIEGAAMARPAIASRVPGCTAVVDDPATGFLCEPRDSGSLASAMARFAALDIDERRAMGLAARAKMEREFAVNIVVARYRQAIADATRGAARAN